MERVRTKTGCLGAVCRVVILGPDMLRFFYNNHLAYPYYLLLLHLLVSGNPLSEHRQVR